MDFLKALFGDGPLTFDQLAEKAKAAKMNIVNLADGGYVSQAKFDDKVNGLNQQVSSLTEQITQRDADMATLRTNLDAAKADASKLPGVQQSLSDLQAKYAHDKTEYEQSMAQQRYEFAVRERANSMKFSSAAAKRAFVQEAISKGFKMDGDSLLGFEDFATKYKADDPGAFAQETPPDNPPAPATPPPPTITLPGRNDKPSGRKHTLAELMQMKNDNPDMEIRFDG